MNSLIKYEDAIRILRESARTRTLRTEKVPLLESQNRVVACDLNAEECIPVYDNSAMDGFALRSGEVVSGQNLLKVSEQRIAGDLPGAPPVNSVAVQVMTGAPMPNGGFDLVIKIEDVLKIADPAGGYSIQFDSLRASGGFVRKKGSDYKPGDLLVARGTRIDPKMILALAALGVSRVPVCKKPKVALISTGNELVAFDEPRVPEGAIRNSTGPFLLETLKAYGCEVRNFGIIGDETSDHPVEFDLALRSALSEEFDLILTTGAVSMGVHDFLRTSVEKGGGRILFHGVAIRPGKPVLFADFPDHPRTSLLGLPGNPVSSVVGADFFVAPFLRTLFGMKEGVLFQGTLTGPVPETPKGLRAFLRARVFALPDGARGVEILPGQGSFMIHSLSQANAWAVVPEEGGIGEGDRIRFQMFSERIDP
ncbi:MAG: molybdopterin molybdotransferase MoeA [Bdellovibrionales bacterium]|nr:molybdopterin molybdotransferase MoeA [Bdellovibrionales bacterium]